VVRLFNKNSYKKLLVYAIVAAALIVVVYSFGLQVKELSINPADIAQAGAARFYEGFVYNSSKLIPNGCLVFSYDPTLFNINGRASAQYYYIYNQTFMNNAFRNYSCLVIDYGYWCGTPGNICRQAFSEYKTQPIATATYAPDNFTYGLYRITGYNAT